ncbi:hypothetical protein A3B60_01260 [Candidatus Peregrinibacteria bacterium RIFCSPLOWO2_01_FULL_39_12]|nr:MAG: hypothetical protein A3B60_01260 [Candidatus Peregrinibacteria bacterium RIFCSPLOWO2_01_FULL_39_12]OGJ43207.1 MAG: hypothetical protein A3I58_00335 [Candidatus Peregrinibacteria bacterium RIFCSPLOWO2_02_FULL_39_10]
MNQNQQKEFDPIRACTDTLYLDGNTEAATQFSDEHLRIDDINFICSLHIKGSLGVRVDPELLLEALNGSETCCMEVLFYLARVQVAKMDEPLILLSNKELEKKEQGMKRMYWLIHALIKTDTSRAKLYLRGLKNKQFITENPLLNQAVGTIS